MSDTWQLWIEPAKRGHDETVMGVAIVHRASDYGLRMMDNGLDAKDRRIWCEKLRDVLNAARNRGEL
jgi:hypothetical protein